MKSPEISFQRRIASRMNSLTSVMFCLFKKPRSALPTIFPTSPDIWPKRPAHARIGPAHCEKPAEDTIFAKASPKAGKFTDEIAFSTRWSTSPRRMASNQSCQFAPAVDRKSPIACCTSPLAKPAIKPPTPTLDHSVAIFFNACATDLLRRRSHDIAWSKAARKLSKLAPLIRSRGAQSAMMRSNSESVISATVCSTRLIN